MGRVRVTATIDRVTCVRQSEGAVVPALDPTSEPYLWAAMFVIDGFQVLIVDPPNFTLHVPDPPLRIQVNQGNHGNLFMPGSPFVSRGVANGDVLEVPAEAGFFRTYPLPRRRRGQRRRPRPRRPGVNPEVGRRARQHGRARFPDGGWRRGARAGDHGKLFPRVTSPAAAVPVRPAET